MLYRRYLLLLVALFVLWIGAAHALKAQTAVPRPPFVEDMSWNGSGTLLAVAYENGVVEILNLQREVEASYLVTDRISSILWNPVLDNLLAFTGDGYWGIYDLKTSEILERLPSFEFIHRDIAWSADGQKLAIPGSDGMGLGADNKILLMNLADMSYEVIDLPYVDVGPLAWHPTNPDLLGMTLYAGVIIIYDVRSQTEVFHYSTSDYQFYSLNWEPEGERVAVHVSTELMTEEIHIYDLETSTLLRHINGDNLRYLTWSPNSELIFSDRQLLRVIDTTTWQEFEPMDTNAPIDRFAVSADIVAYGEAGSAILIAPLDEFLIHQSTQTN